MKVMNTKLLLKLILDRISLRVSSFLFFLLHLSNPFIFIKSPLAVALVIVIVALTMAVEWKPRRRRFLITLLTCVNQTRHHWVLERTQDVGCGKGKDWRARSRRYGHRRLQINSNNCFNGYIKMYRNVLHRLILLFYTLTWGIWNCNTVYVN